MQRKEYLLNQKRTNERGKEEDETEHIESPLTTKCAHTATHTLTLTKRVWAKKYPALEASQHIF